MTTAKQMQGNGTAPPAVGSRLDRRVRRRRASTGTIEAAMRILAADLQSDDGVANGACLEAAERLSELAALLREASGPMSRGHWSTRFRARVARAVR